MSDLSQRIANLSPAQLEILAQRLKKKGGAQPRAAEAIPRREDASACAPLSFAQQRMWFLDQMTPGNALYNIPAAVHLRGRLDVAALERTLGEIIRRHEVLRTTFPTRAGEPVQLVGPAAALTLAVIDLRSVPADVRDAEARRLATEEARRPFDLARGPLLRAQLLKLDEAEHIILVTLHHIISDGWSTGVLMQEIGLLYRAFSSGEPPPLAELSIQYADFAVWQRARLSGATLDEHLAYWKKQLAAAPPMLELPADRPRTLVQTHLGAHHHFVVPAECAQALRALSQREGVTLYMTLLAAFKALLARYTGQTDIVVGTPVANRDRTETEPLIGLLINTLVLRTSLAGAPGFRELLRRVRETVLGAHAHQELPFEKLVEELQPERSLSHAPLFQVEFFLDNVPRTDTRLGELELRPLWTESGAAKFDLTLAMEESDTTIAGRFEYSTDLFDEATIARLARHFQNLLALVAADADRRLDEQPLLTEDERQQLLADWNDTRHDYPRDKCIHELFEAQAARTPDGVALICGEEQMTYAELNARANQLAHHLRRAGVAPEVLVGLCLERSLELVVAILGVLKAGGAYVPLDPRYPRERLEFMTKDAKVRVLVCGQEKFAARHAFAARIVCLDTERAALEQESVHNPQPLTEASNLAYVIYTSGSTGQPKGVAVAHRSPVNLMHALCAAVYAGRPLAGLRVSLNAPFSFDASVQQLMLLTRGATLDLVPADVRADGRALLDYLDARQVEAFDCTPSQLKVLLAAGLLAGAGRGPRLFLVAGEAVDAQLWQELAARGATCGKEFYNIYGPTECTVDATACRVTTARPRPSIGRPLANYRLYVLDARMQPVAVGVTGELYVGGEGLARGYLHRPELTAERFVPDPFGAEAGGRLYRTGDTARWLADGDLEYVGRSDAQVKLRGYRIELGEIEAVLAQCAHVRAAAVALREDASGEQRLVGYVVAEADGALQVSDLLTHMQTRLPDFMIPSAFVLLPSLPLNANGKINRAALPAPDATRPEMGNPYVAPRSETEEVVARIWADVLGLERVGVADNFFELGGHSLLATQIISRVREAFQVELALRVFFEVPTVAGLSERVEAERTKSQQEVLAPIVRRTRAEALPLSYAQERMWFLAQLEPDDVSYNIPAAVRLRGALDTEALERSLNEIVRRHEILRTTYDALDGQPLQIINAPAQSLALSVVDVTDLPAAERESAGLRRLAAEIRRPFDLAQGPLLRATLLRLTAEEHVVLLTMHHIVSDEWSTSVLLREVAALYAAYTRGEPSPLPELPIQYADYAAWQRNWLRGEVLAAQLAYWREHLGGAPAVLELPTDRPRPPVRSFRGRRYAVTLPAEVTEKLKALSRREGVTLFVTLLAAFKSLLYRYTAQEDIVVGTPIANRNQLQVENLIGLFLNTLALRTRLSGAESFSEVLRRVQEAMLGGYAHREVPFEKVVEALTPERSLSHAPIFQVMFTLQNSRARLAQQIDGLRMEPVESDESGAKFDLMLALEESDGALAGSFEYDSDLFDELTIARMARHFEQLVADAAEHPEQKVAELRILSEAEQHQLLSEWNDTARAYPREQCLHQLFEAQVARTPDHLALSAEGCALSYTELNRRANRLAHYLRQLGVGPERRVAVCLRRRPELVVTLLAVLKAGGAYVPLDPSYPQERLAFMLKDSEAVVLITEQDFAERFDVPAAKLLCLEESAALIASQSAADPAPTSATDNLAYVIYTSGSTGTPKGVAVTHQSVVTFAHWTREVFTDEELAGVLFSTSVCFDISVFELFAPLCWGGTVIVADNALQLPALSSATPLTLINTVPSAMTELLRLDLVPPSVCTVNLAGEALPGKLAKEVYNTGTVRRLYNLYGPTEDTVYSTYELVRHATDTAPLIGRPLADTQAYVLDANLRPVPCGITGELYLGGAGLARGYLNRPELTAERFVPDPFATTAGGRLYRTGDLVRRLADGRLDYLGRIDQQVKLRGFRIELGEVEAALCRHEQVGEAVVVAKQTGSSGASERRLVAYLTVRQTAEGEAATVAPPTTAALRQFLKGSLPDYMLPAEYVVLARLPLTPNGKVDRKALPAPDGAARPANEYIAPRTPVEEVVAGVWAEVLGRERVGVADNFFELGGHSLLATQVIARVRDALRVNVPLRAVFESPTVAEFVRVVSAHEAQPGATEKIARVLLKLRNMSADEKRRLLEQRKRQMVDPATVPHDLAAAGEITATQPDAALVNQ